MAKYFLCFNGRMVPPLQLEDSFLLWSVANSRGNWPMCWMRRPTRRADGEAPRWSTSKAPSWEEQSGSASFWLAEVSGAPTSGAADCISPSTTAPRRASEVPEDGASGTSSGVSTSKPAPLASSNACLPASTLGAGSVLAARRGATTTGFSQGPTRPTGQSPHSSKEGIYPANSTLFEQRYKRQPPCGISPDEGLPVKTSSTVLCAPGESSDS